MPRQTSPLSIEYVLLGFLDQEPIHGYDLHKRLNSLESIGMVWKIKQSQLYALLERLEDDGLVTSKVVPGESHPNRKQFSITSEGRKTFTTWRSSPVEHGREIRMEFLAKLYFALKVTDKTAINLIEEQKRGCSEWLGHMEASYKQIAEDQLFEKIVFQYRISQMHATIDWLAAIHKEIDNLK
jgi:PadR family transcriptional regulator, regulatory protein AphA